MYHQGDTDVGASCDMRSDRMFVLLLGCHIPPTIDRAEPLVSVFNSNRGFVPLAKGFLVWIHKHDSLSV